MNVSSLDSWLIPTDIFMILCSLLIFIFAGLFLLIIIFDKTCHTIAMLLIANSCLTAFLLGCILLSLSLFTLNNDLKKVVSKDSLCIFRAYINYTLSAELMFSFLLQAFYRYVIVIYHTHLFWQTLKCQYLLISLTWIFSSIYPLGFLLFDQITYNIDNQICQLPLRLSFAAIYGSFCIYLLPVCLTIFLYLKLIFYIKQLRHNTMIVYTLIRAQEQLKMVKRIIIVLNLILTIGIPYGIFVFISFFTSPPKYHFRIAFIFTNVSLVMVLIILFLFTDPLRKSLKKKFLAIRPNTVAVEGRI